MESCNSGSFQSSSGGDDEYDSRATFTSCGIGQVNPNSPPPTPLFDPFTAKYTELSHPKTTPHPITDNYSILSNNDATATANSYDPFTQPFQPATAPPMQQKIAARNPKKRSRASRRAPTTVLATDTTNFRAMVQEFTGIPAPPFSNNLAASPFARNNRLDLFGSSIDAPPSHLRSSFARRVQSSSAVLPFLGGRDHHNKDDDIIVGSDFLPSSSAQSLDLVSNSADEKTPFLGSMNLPTNHQKIDSFGPRYYKDGDNASAAFDGGLQNLIVTSNILTLNQENADDHDRVITGKSVANHPSLSGGEREREY